MDIFEEFLKNSKDETIALRDRSYKNVRQKSKECIQEYEVNTELSTYGDALLKFLLCDIIYKKRYPLTEQKKKYESDKIFVEKIAKRYNLIEFIKKDDKDLNLPDDYEYGEAENEKNHHKYIATAVEACLGEMYRSKKYKIDDLKKLVEEWIDYIDADQ